MLTDPIATWLVKNSAVPAAPSWTGSPWTRFASSDFQTRPEPSVANTSGRPASKTGAGTKVRKALTRGRLESVRRLSLVQFRTLFEASFFELWFRFLPLTAPPSPMRLLLLPLTSSSSLSRFVRCRSSSYPWTSPMTNLTSGPGTETEIWLNLIRINNSV